MNQDLSNHISIQELFTLCQTFSEIWNSIQSEIKDEKTIIVFFLGSPNSGKTTFFEYLKNDEFDILDKSKDISKSKKPQWLNFFTVESSGHHLFLDFHSTLNSEQNINNLIFEELFLRLIKEYQIKIVYILEHQISQLMERGSHLKEFIRKYLVENKENQTNLMIVLNKYLEDQNDDDLIQSVRQQLQEMKMIAKQEIFVLREKKPLEELKTVFSIEKKKKILSSIIQSSPIQIQFALNWKLMYDVDVIFKETFISIFQKMIEKNIKVNILDQEELKERKKYYQAILNTNTQKTDPELFCFYNIDWNHLVQDTISNDISIYKKYSQLKDIQTQFRAILLKSEILEEINKMILNTCLILLKSVEKYIKEDFSYNNNIPEIVNNTKLNFDSFLKKYYEFEDYKKCKLNELSSMIKELHEKEPCEKTSNWIKFIEQQSQNQISMKNNSNTCQVI